MCDIIERIDALLANTPQSEIEEFEVTRCLRDARDELIAASTLTGVMLQGTGQRIAENMAERVMNGMVVRHWIPVSAWIPTEATEVLVAWNLPRGGQQVDAALYFRNGMWAASAGHSIGRVTHWMPLPQPPEVTP